MVVQNQFLNKGNHLQNWQLIKDIKIEIAGEPKAEILIITLEGEDRKKLKMHLSKTDISKMKKMLGLINEIENAIN